MQYRIVQCVVIAVLIVGLFGCNAMTGRAEKEKPAQEVMLSEVPEPARATIGRLTTGGQITKLEKELVDGKVVYDIEATIKDKEVEYDVAADGTILSSEETVPYTSLPAAVRIAVRRYFDSDEGLKTSKEIENGKTFYEVEGKKGGSMVELKLSETGKILEKEND
jgi:uncharacterized membrane protein YkoI